MDTTSNVDTAAAAVETPNKIIGREIDHKMHKMYDKYIARNLKKQEKRERKNKRKR